MNAQTRIAATFVALFACAGAHAQLLGGAINGAAGGALNGNLAGPIGGPNGGGLEGSAMGRGALSGTGQLDMPATDRLSHRVGNVSNRVSERSRQTVGRTGEQAQNAVDSTRSRATRTGNEVSRLADRHQAQDIVSSAAAGQVVTGTETSIDGATSASPSLAIPETEGLPMAPLAEPAVAAENSATGNAGPAEVEAATEGKGSFKGANASANASVQGSAQASR